MCEARVKRYCVDNARGRGRPFRLSVAEFSQLISANCAYCGGPPRNKLKNRNYIFFYQGIDRLDNDKGYVPGNCVPCCSRCNSIKGEHLSHEEMILVASLLLGLRRSRLPGTQGPRAREDSTRSPRKAKTR